MFSRSLFPCVIALSLISSAAHLSAEERLPIAPIRGLELTQGNTVALPGHNLAFKFKDGRICTGGSQWSEDGGKTWKEGPRGPDDKMAFDFGDGEVLSVSRDLIPRPDGKFTVKYRRSTDNWKTVHEADGIADIPLSTSQGTDNTTPRLPGMLMHHGIVQLKDGTLLASLYGNYKGDNILNDATPPEMGNVKTRTIVVSSSDRGKTWGNPVTVGYDKMMGILYAPDITGNRFTIVSATTHEGFNEADLEIAPNGDIICVMRSGSGNTFGLDGEDIMTPESTGRYEGYLTIFATPLYASRSTDNGKTWTTPIAIADRGCCPSVVTLENGIMVCVYNRPGVWVIFSDDNGMTWKGATQIGHLGRKYCYITDVGPDSFMVFRQQEDPNGKRGEDTLATAFTVRKR